MSLRMTSAPLVLVGHSHVALGLRESGNDVTGGLAPAGTELELEGRWLLNPGSVGQPRDGDPHAAWLLVDLVARRATFHRVPYDIAATQREMRAAGLPELLARRLEGGQRDASQPSSALRRCSASAAPPAPTGRCSRTRLHSGCLRRSTRRRLYRRRRSATSTRIAFPAS